MGTNLFVEGNPSPVAVHVRLPVPVTSFAELRRLASGLAAVEDHLRREWHRGWPSFRPRRVRDVRLLRFEVHSPPEFTLLADPAWLSVFIAVLVGYPDAKRSVSEMRADARRIFAAIKGLTDREMELLEISVRLTLERVAAKGESISLKLAGRFAALRQSVSADTEDKLEIRVVNIDPNSRW